MELQNKATRINLFNFSTPQMRAFHMSWFAFFLCFFAWFGIAPLMNIVREEMSLTKEQIGWCIIGSVAITVIARLFIGWLCDQIGPRLAYTWLLVLGAIPVMGIGFAHDYTTFLIFRIAIGAIGAAFVITQYHTSLMFAPNCVGTANATTAGWGNLGGGVTQMVMPLIFGLFVGILGFSDSIGWRASMFLAGLVCALTGIAYYFLTQDAPDGNFKELREAGKMPQKAQQKGQFLNVCKDHRVWALFVIYGACFGIELTINNVAALYFLDYFDYFKSMDTTKAVKMAGLFAGMFGLMNIFARTLGGIFGDRFGQKWGLSGRVKWLFIAVFCEGIALMIFSQMSVLAMALPSLIVFSLFVQMSEGATYSVVPFINKKALGAVSGIVGAGGNAGAVTAGFLFKTQAINWPTALFILGAIVTCCAFLTFLVRFSEEMEEEARLANESALAPQPGEQELAPSMGQ
ncbi:MFS transporter [Gimesia chilikensis]|uniref:MFS transporter n=1 Tax=Gimesia chilikensis TaxID=2605989 RepID=UPI003A953601